MFFEGGGYKLRAVCHGARTVSINETFISGSQLNSETEYQNFKICGLRVKITKWPVPTN